MRNMCSGIIVSAASMLLLPALAIAQDDAQRSPWKYYPEEVRANEGPGGPAPVRDITGTWVGESSGGGVKRLVRPEMPPPLTELGQRLFDSHIVEGGDVSVSETNDPHYRYCDPFGFPRNMNDQIRSMTIATIPDRTFVMLKFMNIWREIWTDGRELPTTFRGRGPDVHDPTYNGYSVGYWEDDYTFVVKTTGLDPGTWATEWGHPHSIDAVVTERFHRSSKNDLTVTTTMVDPRLYTREVQMGEVYFRWSPRQTFFDFSCVPSTVQRYLEEMADPAGTGADP
jgi:hypothetical protein